MRKKRKHLGTFILSMTVFMLPLLHLLSTTVSRNAQAELNECYRVSNSLDLQSDTSSEVELLEHHEDVSTPTVSESLSTSSNITEEADDKEIQSSSETSENTKKYIDGLEESEYWWLCKIVMAEVGYSSYEAQLAVASEVLNRRNCWYFPDTIEEVLMQPGQYYDGPPTIAYLNEDGEWDRKPVEESDINDSVKRAVHAALTDGVDYSNGAFFHTGLDAPAEILESFYRNYGEPCLQIGTGLFFTADLCDSLEEWQAKYILGQ